MAEADKADTTALSVDSRGNGDTTPKWARSFADDLVARLSTPQQKQPLNGNDRVDTPEGPTLADILKRRSHWKRNKRRRSGRGSYRTAGVLSFSELEEGGGFNPCHGGEHVDWQDNHNLSSGIHEHRHAYDGGRRPLLDTGLVLSGFLLGDAPQCASWARNNSWMALVADCTLRGCGQVVFCNNPLSGLLILIALALGSPVITVFGIVGAFTATVFGGLILATQETHAKVQQGLFGYNGLLVGLAMATFSNDVNPALLLPVMAISILSSILFMAVSKWLEIYKVSALTLPFNIACLIWFSFTLSSDFYNTTLAPAPVVLNASQASVPSATTHDEAIYGKLWAIFPRGVAQIFLCGRYESGIIILVAMALCSPTSAALCLYGSIVGSSMALATGVPDNLVEKGLYGYNSALGAMAIGAVVYKLNRVGFIFSTICAMICVYMTPLFAVGLAPVGTAAQTFPFCFGTLIVLLLGEAVPELELR